MYKHRGDVQLLCIHVMGYDGGIKKGTVVTETILKWILDIEKNVKTKSFLFFLGFEK